MILLIKNLLIAMALVVSFTGVSAKEKHWGRLVHCVTPPKLKQGKVCVLETKGSKARKGSSVLVYNRRFKWIDTGTVYKRKGKYTVVIFQNSMTPILNSYFFRIDPNNDNFDWESSFSNRSLQSPYDI
ncbi:MAG: hypothetical protein AB8G05_26715 [Oligoflexales bacterium]